MRPRSLHAQHRKEHPHEASAEEARYRHACWDHVRGGGHRSGSRGAGTSQWADCNGPGQDAHPGSRATAGPWR